MSKYRRLFWLYAYKPPSHTPKKDTNAMNSPAKWYTHAYTIGQREQRTHSTWAMYANVNRRCHGGIVSPLLRLRFRAYHFKGSDCWKSPTGVLRCSLKRGSSGHPLTKPCEHLWLVFSCVNKTIFTSNTQHHSGEKEYYNVFGKLYVLHKHQLHSCILQPRAEQTDWEKEER